MMKPVSLFPIRKDSVRASALLHQADTDEQRRILLALLAFAAGDAFGVAYEYLPERVPVDATRIGTRADWPLGGVSDDTHLSLLTIFAAHAGEPVASAAAFLTDLRQAVPRLRGLGPTTRAALGLESEPDENLVVVGTTIIGNTNGAMMRTSLLGLAYPAGRDAERREMVASLAEATHKASAAVACAQLCSALYSRALDGVNGSFFDDLKEEAASLPDLSDELAAWLGDPQHWSPPAAGIALDPVETLAAVVWVAGQARDVLDAFRLACEIGGDTDTVAALAGGLVAARSGRPDEFLSISWVDDVMWSEIPEIVAAAARLSNVRATR